MKALKGAEATLEFEEDHVVKRREPKKYRHNDLDRRIREERTETEKKLIQEAKKHGVTVPGTEKIDDSTLKMDRIDGEALKEVVESQTSPMIEHGENVAMLHSADIIHGDLTTSNALVDGKNLYLIDFGLAFRSQRTEDKAVDIHLLKQVLNSSHPASAEKAWENFLQGYREYSESDKVLEQLEEVEKRGRYK